MKFKVAIKDDLEDGDTSELPRITGMPFSRRHGRRGIGTIKLGILSELLLIPIRKSPVGE